MKLKLRVIILAVLLAMLTGAFVSTAQTVENEQQVRFTAPILVVNTSFLNIRTGPGIEYTVALTVVGGTELPVLGVARDRVWYQVSTIIGTGWVNSQFTLPRGDFTNVPFVERPSAAQQSTTTFFDDIVQEDSTGAIAFASGREWGVSVIEPHPFRTGPTINSSSIGTISANPGIIYTVLEAASQDTGVWYRVDDPTLGVGWVEAIKAQFRPFGCELSVVIFNSTTALGRGPDGSGTIDGDVTVNPGQEAYLVDAANNLYKVELRDGSTGWVSIEAAEIRDRDTVSSDYCASGGVIPSALTSGTGTTATTPNTSSTQPQFTGPRAIINTGFLNLRSGPGAQFTVVTSLPGGTELQVIGVAEDFVWYLVRGTFGQAWLNSEFVLFRGDGSTLPIIRDFGGAQISTPLATITNAVTLYSSPSTSGGVIGALSGPIEVNIVARTSDFSWVQLNTPLGFGWVPTNQVSLQGDTSLIPVVNG